MKERTDKELIEYVTEHVGTSEAELIRFYDTINDDNIVELTFDNPKGKIKILFPLPKKAIEQIHRLIEEKQLVRCIDTSTIPCNLIDGMPYCEGGRVSEFKNGKWVKASAKIQNACNFLFYTREYAKKHKSIEKILSYPETLD